jgi:hypothetical protein
MKGARILKKLLFVMLIIMAFAVVSCGEKTETTVDETEKDTQVAQAGDMQVTQCDGNVCTHETASSRECAVDGKCPQMEQAAMAKAGVGCPHAAECAKAGKCTGKCGGACKGECTYCKTAHVCTEACPENCPYAAAHVCTGECGADCPHAQAAGACSSVKQAAKADGCGGCPRAKTCKAGS